MKFTLICEPSYATNNSKLTYEFTEESLPDVLNHLTYFLHGVGFTYLEELQYTKHEYVSNAKRKVNE